MTSTQEAGQALTPRVSSPARVGQATAVEQSRAVAQVEAQIVVAMRYPRNVAVATAAMREACEQQRLAEKAFFRFPRAGSTITGPSIHLARELARVWGNIEYGVHEMRRDDAAAQSEMLAFAWDLQTNARNSAVFINPHVRDRREGGPVQLTDVRDIYENNANAGARRVREAIFATLPTWFVEEAVDLCNKTLTGGGGKPLAQRVADAIAAFGTFGVTAAQVEAKLGRTSDEWLPQDLAQLMVIYRSLERGEISKDEEFPPVTERVTAAEIAGHARQPASDPSKGAQAPPAAPVAPDAPAPIGAAEFGKLLASVPLGKAQDVKDFLSWQAKRAVSNIKDLTDAERAEIAAVLRDAVAGAEGNDPDLAVTALWDRYHAEHEQNSSDSTAPEGQGTLA